MAVGTLVFDRSSYEMSLCLGLPARGGRPQDEQALRERPRADRADGPARGPRGPVVHACVGFALDGSSSESQGADEIVCKVLRTYWTTAAFQSLYARANGWTPGADRPAGRRCSIDGRRRQSRRLVTEVTDALTDFDTARAGRCSPGTSTTCPTGTCAVRAAVSGTATPRHRHPPRAPAGADPG